MWEQYDCLHYHTLAGLWRSSAKCESKVSATQCQVRRLPLQLSRLWVPERLLPKGQLPRRYSWQSCTWRGEPVPNRCGTCSLCSTAVLQPRRIPVVRLPYHQCLHDPHSQLTVTICPCTSNSMGCIGRRRGCSGSGWKQQMRQILRILIHDVHCIQLLEGAIEGGYDDLLSVVGSQESWV